MILNLLDCIISDGNFKLLNDPIFNLFYGSFFVSEPSGLRRCKTLDEEFNFSFFFMIVSMLFERGEFIKRRGKGEL